MTRCNPAASPGKQVTSFLLITDCKDALISLVKRLKPNIHAITNLTKASDVVAVVLDDAFANFLLFYYVSILRNVVADVNFSDALN